MGGDMQVAYNAELLTLTGLSSLDHIDGALFTAPARADHSGAGLFNDRGACLAGAVVQHAAECLSGFVIGQLARPGAPDQGAGGRFDPPHVPRGKSRAVEERRAGDPAQAGLDAAKRASAMLRRISWALGASSKKAR